MYKHTHTEDTYSTLYVYRQIHRSRLLTNSWRGHGEMHRFISHNANTPALWEWGKKMKTKKKNLHILMTFGPQKTKHTH